MVWLPPREGSARWFLPGDRGSGAKPACKDKAIQEQWKRVQGVHIPHSEKDVHPDGASTTLTEPC